MNDSGRAKLRDISLRLLDILSELEQISMAEWKDLRERAEFLEGIGRLELSVDRVDDLSECLIHCEDLMNCVDFAIE
jgi:hypothetical protein